jgi:hypothetical protein
MRRSLRLSLVPSIALLAALLLTPGTPALARPAAHAAPAFAGPIFGMDNRGGALFVADSGAGVVRVRNGHHRLVAALPNVTDVDVYARNAMLAVTGGPGSKLYRIVNGNATLVARLGAFERRVNPDGGQIDSNAFGVTALRNGGALVADAGANDVLRVSRRGRVDWVATLPGRVVPTANAKRVAGCPHPSDPGNEQICQLPARIPAESVATSVQVGPDGDYFVSELIGFPAAPGFSRVWRIDRNTHHARCGSSRRCHVALRHLTSIVDLAFQRNGTLNVVEFAEESWFAVESGLQTTGTVDACNVWSGRCHALAHLPMPSAVATTKRHTYATILSLVPGQSGVVAIG